MEYIEIDSIVIKENVRKDYGDLTELAASINAHGIRKPIELNKKNELVDGFRRIRAAKALGLKKVPFFYNDDAIDNTTEQLLSGIFSKNLNPVEEGQAFVKYLAEHKILIKDLAKKISKTEGYIQKRIEVATLPKEITEELVNKKIELGHALLLKKMPEPEAKKFLKEIIRDNLSVLTAKNNAQWQGARLQNAPFDKDQCKGCKFNGSEQSELFETGKILNGTCMNKGCYAKKMQEYIKTLKEKYKDVLVDKIPAGYLRADSYEANQRMNKAYMEKCRKSKENYAVIIDESYGVRIIEYFKPKPKKADKTKNADDEVREQKLGNRIEEFKIAFLIEKCREKIVPGSKEAKALALLEIDHGVDVKKAFSSTEKELDKQIAVRSINALYGMTLKNLLIATGNNGVDIRKQFVITKEFLNLHTKDQLMDLIKELKLKSKVIEENVLSKEDLVRYILEGDILGKIPKSML